MTTTATDTNTNESTLRSARSPYGNKIRELIGAGFQAMLTRTSEPLRALQILLALATDLDYQFITWDVARGYQTTLQRRNGEEYNPFALDEDEAMRLCEPNYALDAIPRMSDIPDMPNNSIIVMLNFEPYWDEPSVRQRFQTLCDAKLLASNLSKRPIIFLQHNDDLHDSVRPYVQPVPFQLPTPAEMNDVFEFVTATTDNVLTCPDDLRNDVVTALCGLTSIEAEDTLSLSLRVCHGLTPDVLDIIEDEKATVIGKSDVLRYVPKAKIEATDLLQGFDDFLRFIQNRAVAYDPAARELNIDLPKGVVLLGQPGTGKSLCAKLVAKMLRRPLIMWDIGAMFGSLVGQTEQRMRDAIRTIEALRGAVVVIDEADKVLAGMADGRGDSGVSSRVFGQLLSWLQSKDDESFVIVTMNRTAGIPPEFFRTGRFDAVFGVVEPDKTTRRNIMQVHLLKRGVDPDDLGFTEDDWASLETCTEHMVGSDLEESVKYARAAAFLARGATGGAIPTFDELYEAIQYVRPHIAAELDKDGTAAIRKFVTERTRLVYNPRQRSTVRTSRRGRGVEVTN